MQLGGKVAIVTGGAQGFGEGIVDHFIQQGCRVLLVDLQEDLGTAKAKSYATGSCHFTRADVSQRDDWERIRDCVHRTFGRLDIVVNNAGWTYAAKSTLHVTQDDFDRVFAVNVASLFHSVAVLVPYVQEQGQGGVFITISSTAALRPRPRLTWYNATKGAVSVASKSMALEFAGDNIRFNTICPVAGNTPLLASFAGGHLTDETRDVLLKSVPLGRLSEARDIAHAAVFLASDAGSFITGIDFPVDGGRCV